jgi:hypothetical protein
LTYRNLAFRGHASFAANQARLFAGQQSKSRRTNPPAGSARFARRFMVEQAMVLPQHKSRFSVAASSN